MSWGGRPQLGVLRRCCGRLLEFRAITKLSRDELCWRQRVAVLDNGRTRRPYYIVRVGPCIRIRTCVRQYARSISKDYSMVVVVFIDTIGISWPSLFFAGAQSFLSLLR